MSQTLTLRDLADEALALDQLIAMDDGEWTDEHEHLANELTEKLLRKTDSFANYLTDLSQRAEILRAEEKRLAERRRRIERDCERLENYAQLAMARMQTAKLVGTTHTIAVRMNPPAVKVNEDELRTDSIAWGRYAEMVTTWKIDRAQIKRDMQTGIQIPGCELVQGTRLEVK